MLTQEYLKSILHYNPETGIFTWLISKGKAKYNNIAGGKNIRGYMRIVIDKKTYLSHRLAFLYMTGEWPKKDVVDHVNNIFDDNRWSNLREATHRENNYNKKVSTYNKSGTKGVHIGANGKFRAYICLGSFDTKEEAAEVYAKYAKLVQGEFIHKSVKKKE